jgi:putative transcriptional regulator
MFDIAYIMCGRTNIQKSMSLLNRIKQHRARLDLTQQQMAERTGVRRQTILAIEKGRYVPSALLAFKIARVLGMRVDEIFELDEKDSKYEE